MRVRPRWKSDRVGRITDIEGWEADDMSADPKEQLVIGRLRLPHLQRGTHPAFNDSVSTSSRAGSSATRALREVSTCPAGATTL